MAVCSGKGLDNAFRSLDKAESIKRTRNELILFMTQTRAEVSDAAGVGLL